MHKAPRGRTLSTPAHSSGTGLLCAQGIRAAFDHLSLVIDDSVGWVPDAPHLYLKQGQVERAEAAD
jgi:hypothetical protein